MTHIDSRHHIVFVPETQFCVCACMLDYLYSLLPCHTKDLVVIGIWHSDWQRQYMLWEECRLVPGGSGLGIGGEEDEAGGARRK